MSAKPQIYEGLPLEELRDYVDMWNLASYDYISSNSILPTANHSGHCSNFWPSNMFNISLVTPYNTNAALTHYSNKGIDLSTVNIGIPLYATQFHETDGPGTKFGHLDYHPLDEFFPQFFDNVMHDTAAMAAFAYEKETRIMTSLECTATVDFKADIVKNLTLGGIAWMKAIGEGNGRLVHRVSEMASWTTCSILIAVGYTRPMGRCAPAIRQYT